MNFKERLIFYVNINLNDNMIDNLNVILENIAININFNKRLDDSIYNWYVDEEHLLLRFIFLLFFANILFFITKSELIT